MKTITVQQIIDAIAKNGLPWGKNMYFTINRSGYVASACVLGQAAHNLDVDPEALYQVIDTLTEGRVDSIVSYNDNDAVDYADAANMAIEILNDLMWPNDPITILEMGDRYRFRKSKKSLGAR